MKLLILINHELTETQIEELKCLGYDDQLFLKEVNPILFAKIANSPDNQSELIELCKELVKENVDAYLRPLGSPAFNAVFDRFLYETHHVSLFSHSDRVAIEEKQEDGSVVKKSIFKHKKFIRIDLKLY